MEIKREISNRFRAMYFVAATVVISIHCGIETPSIGYLQGLYLKYLTKWAVPFFFFMSGIFFQYSYKNNYIGFKNCASRKFHTLVLPYVLWCIIGAFLRLPIIGARLTGCGLSQVFDLIFGISSQFPIGNGVLWFLRSLIAYQYGTMILMGCFSRDKKLRCTCIIFMVIIGLAFISSDISQRFLVSFCGTPSSPIYFIVGLISSSMVLRTDLSKRQSVIVCIVSGIGMGILFCTTLIDQNIGRHLSNFLIVTVLWTVVDLFADKVQSVAKVTFFIYCFHRVPVEYLNLFFVRMGLYNMLNSDAYYMLLVLCSVVGITYIAIFMKEKGNWVYLFLSGTRR